jgi:hypothetical protein
LDLTLEAKEKRRIAKKFCIIRNGMKTNHKVLDTFQKGISLTVASESIQILQNKSY